MGKSVISRWCSCTKYDFVPEEYFNRKRTWWDLIWDGMAMIIGGVIAAGILLLSGVDSNQLDGPFVLLFVLFVPSFLLSFFYSVDFGVQIPDGSFFYLLVELVYFMTYIALNIFYEYVIGSIAMSHSWPSYLEFFVRFVMWTVSFLVYYVFYFGLHSKLFQLKAERAKKYKDLEKGLLSGRDC